MAWVPFIVANRRNRYHRRSGAGIILALVIFFLMFGVMFFMIFDWRSNFMPSMWVMFSGVGGFLLILGICLAITAVTSQTHKKPSETIVKPYVEQPQNQPQFQQVNPYNIRYKEQEQKREPQYPEVNQDIPVVSKINYCRFCGAEVEGDAFFCHQCGTKL